LLSLDSAPLAYALLLEETPMPVANAVAGRGSAAPHASVPTNDTMANVRTAGNDTINPIPI
jgi:hypothetical protein